MNQQRRDALRISTVMSLAIAAGILKPGDVFAAEDWNKASFDARSVPDVQKVLGAAAPASSKEINIIAPDIAENGSVVPVGVNATLPNVQQIAILVEKNPSPLAGNFFLPAGTDGFVSTRVKMGQSSNVHTLVKADGKWYVATKEVKVTLGGCGG